MLGGENAIAGKGEFVQIGDHLQCAARIVSIGLNGTRKEDRNVGSV